MQTRSDTPTSPAANNGLDAIQEQLERLRSALNHHEFDPFGSSSADPTLTPANSDAPPVDPPAIERTPIAVQPDDREAELSHEPAEALRLREERLTQMKAMLKEEAFAVRRQAEALETQRRYAREVLEQRNGVLELQRLLNEAEQRMIKRWGIHQAFGWSIRAALCLGLLLGISYFVSGQLAHQTWMASAIVRHQGSELAPDVRWLEEQRKRLTSPETLSRTSGRLRQSGFLGPAQPEDLAKFLETGLKTSTPGSNVLHLELHGENPEDTVKILNALIAVYSTHNAGQEKEAFVPRMRIAQEAKLSPIPVTDNRSELTAMMFAASAVVTVILVVLCAVLASRLSRGEVQAINLAPLADGDVWKSYHKALEHPTSSEANPLF